tara:strand:- start:6365 stop:7402 length:1038 start_codon:yes stop_codon:yes gene_type:complete
MQVLNQYQSSELLQRFPSFELSYETVSHKKVSEQYNITLAIPYGKKAYMWFTFYKDKNVCFLLETARDKKISKVTILSDSQIPCKLAYNTLLYGSLCEFENHDVPFFLVEELLYYTGISLFKQPLRERFSFLELFFQEYNSVLKTHCPMGIALPMIWTFNENLPLSWQDSVPYQVHHLQHRCLDKIVPYINEPLTKNILAPKPVTEMCTDLFLPPPLPRFDFLKQQYKQPTCFEVKPDLQNDIYHLYAFGRKSERVYCGLAYLPSYASSVFMNSLFRNIKENRSLDALEESDDEDDFQDIRHDKYVDLEKTIVIECVFQRKFRKWKPVRAIYKKEQGKIVHISRL